MNLLRKIRSRGKAGWQKQMVQAAKGCQSAMELCQWVACEIEKPIYPIEQMGLPACGKLIDTGHYFVICHQPAPPLVSELTILHELTHILFLTYHGHLGEEVEVERFAFELFRRIYHRTYAV